MFLGYANGVKGYRLWDPTSHKVVISRDVIFKEDKEQEQVDGESTETTTVQVEKEVEATPEHEVHELAESEDPEVRWSTHTRKAPSWHSDYIIEGNIAYYLLTEDGEPSTLQ